MGMGLGRSRSPSQPKKQTYNNFGTRAFNASMDSDSGACHMASQFLQIFKESGLQRQLEDGWGQSYTGGSAPGSASAHSEDVNQGCQFNPKSLRSSKTPSPPSSRKHREEGDPRSRKSKRSRNSDVKEENEEEDDIEVIPVVQQGSGRPYSPVHDCQPTKPREDRATSGYQLNRDSYGGREYLSDLDTELDALRKHLLQRANPPRSYP
ncbi:hypothetical protein BBK36DRAFT_1191791 [Trichoderma citrinoviride]|uniref:Uncharacterized protein n=1 Tax=Trichoderma citrinoviride TaxID=58853 RepID=A0A2T4BHG7_9HYPO|nr:hypothetical protein BBK36DRAFT_1191791 [Trichoderma citrinoviride]PTB68752.1 hypothetical protein BBK36DRAFT_1191791 [Trichoderma citrinoviride]